MNTVGRWRFRGACMGQNVTTNIRFVAAVPQRTAEYYRDVLGFQIAGYWDGVRVNSTADTPPVFAILCSAGSAEFSVGARGHTNVNQAALSGFVIMMAHRVQYEERKPAEPHGD